MPNITVRILPDILAEVDISPQTLLENDHYTVDLLYDVVVSSFCSVYAFLCYKNSLNKLQVTEETQMGLSYVSTSTTLGSNLCVFGSFT